MNSTETWQRLVRLATTWIVAVVGLKVLSLCLTFMDPSSPKPAFTTQSFCVALASGLVFVVADLTVNRQAANGLFGAIREAFLTAFFGSAGNLVILSILLVALGYARGVNVLGEIVTAVVLVGACTSVMFLLMFPARVIDLFLRRRSSITDS